jgi:hypothetical protein
MLRSDVIRGRDLGFYYEYCALAVRLDVELDVEIHTEIWSATCYEICNDCLEQLG